MRLKNQLKCSCYCSYCSSVGKRCITYFTFLLCTPISIKHEQAVRVCAGDRIRQEGLAISVGMKLRLQCNAYTQFLPSVGVAAGLICIKDCEIFRQAWACESENSARQNTAATTARADETSSVQLSIDCRVLMEIESKQFVIGTQ